MLHQQVCFLSNRSGGAILIEKRTMTVYFSSTKNKTYITKRGAIRAEAEALLEKRYPTEKPYFEDNYCIDSGWCWKQKPRSNVLLRRVMRIVKKIY